MSGRSKVVAFAVDGRRRHQPRTTLAWVATISIALAGCSDNAKTEGAGASGPSTTVPASGPGARVDMGAPGSPQRISVQPADLPAGLHLCEYPGEDDTYIENIKPFDPEIYQSVVKTWGTLKSMGAVRGYYGVYGSNQFICDFVAGKAEADHSSGGQSHDDNARNHPATVISFVVEYKDEAAAADVYKSDVFTQSNLRAPEYQVTHGEATGLGPNSVVGSKNAAPPILSSVWQTKSFTVLFLSEALQPAESEAVLDAMYSRIP